MTTTEAPTTTTQHWHTRAACRGHPQPLWDDRLDTHPPELEHERRARHAAALAICAGCPTVDQCLADRLAYRDEQGDDHGDPGIYGGHLFGGTGQGGARQRAYPNQPSQTKPPVIEPCTDCRHLTVQAATHRRRPDLRDRYRARTGGLCSACRDRQRRNERARWEVR